MQVSDPNDVKIYNLSAGKSLPEWLSERKRRALLKKDVDIRRRIELIQDFDMPGLSTSVRVSRDGQYIMATGIYKPRIKCFDVNNLSLKFERCFDSECVTFEILSDDYSKGRLQQLGRHKYNRGHYLMGQWVLFQSRTVLRAEDFRHFTLDHSTVGILFLQCDRSIDFHVAHGHHHRLRIPKFGRDMQYHYPTCDLYVVGVSSDVYRLNLERGQFLTPFTSTAASINKCAINPVHHLVICGTQEGRIDAWDPRSKVLAATLDCAFCCVNENKELEGFPSISALKFNGGLHLGVGTATGQVLLYDIRSNKPYYVKDHMYGLPIKDVDFHYQHDLIYSMDSSVLKIWDKNNGKLFTSIEASTEYNNLCVVPSTGLMFIANESTKILTYYIPGLGPAPRWAGFLDSLTEELEESNAEIVYDDYKFVTRQELENLGLEHLLGTNLLRAYMHGYFMDVRLYKKAKTVANPFEFEEYRKKKIRETIEKDRVNRVQVNKLPKVNKDLALKLMGDQMNGKKKKNAGDLLNDNRFKSLFENPDFEVDKNADEFRLLNPVLSRLDKSKKKELQKKLVGQEFESVEEELEGKNSSEESSDEYVSDDSSDEDQSWKKEMKKQHKIIQREHRQRERMEQEEEIAKEKDGRQPKFFELRQGEEFKGVHNMKKKLNKATLGERLKSEESSVKLLNSVGNREMTFVTNKNRRDKTMDERNRRHREERKKLLRPTFGIKSKHKGIFSNKRRK